MSHGVTGGGREIFVPCFHLTTNICDAQALQHLPQIFDIWQKWVNITPQICVIHIYYNSSHKYQIFEREKHKHCTNIGDAVLRTVFYRYFAFH